ncbi:sigma factor G inhibitor Gin [Ectobacillus panaciterrae]|uniref:sigma factor G inhibitor Gin n=1 Tax=Ectobacillus panaciterrae TaxID=363872 RepID=UPI00040E01BB|nr:sigma factor G inhibitor Gin [Ectobacillus panaciterrae]
MSIAVRVTQLKCCIVCEEKKEKGIHLYNGFICETCEKDIIHTETDDPKYAFYLKQLRKVCLPEQ